MNRRSFLSWFGLAPAVIFSMSAAALRHAPLPATIVAMEGRRAEAVLDDMAAERALRAGDYTLFTHDSLQAFQDRYPARPRPENMQLPAGWAGASGGDGRGRALQVAARPPIPFSPLSAVTRELSSGAPGHGRMDAAGPGGPAAPPAKGRAS